MKGLWLVEDEWGEWPVVAASAEAALAEGENAEGLSLLLEVRDRQHAWELASALLRLFPETEA